MYSISLNIFITNLIWYVLLPPCRDLLAMVKVVEDAPSERAMQLELGGKIKPRSKVIPEVEHFGTDPA